MPPQDGNLTISKKWIGGLVAGVILLVVGALLTGAINSFNSLAQTVNENEHKTVENEARIEKHEDVVDQCVDNIKKDISEMKIQMSQQTNDISKIREENAEIKGMLRQIANDLNDDN